MGNVFFCKQTPPKKKKKTQLASLFKKKKKKKINVNGVYWLYVSMTGAVRRYDVTNVATSVPTYDSSWSLSPAPTGTLSGIAAHPDDTLLVCAATSGIARYTASTGVLQVANAALNAYTAVDKWDFGNGTHDVYAIRAAQSGTSPNLTPAPLAVLKWSDLTVKWMIDFPSPGPPPGVVQSSIYTWSPSLAIPNSLVVSNDG